MRPIHSQRIERWLGPEKVAHIRQAMRGWYYRPICLLDVPGSVWVGADGDFYGHFERGYFASALDQAYEFWRRLGKVQYGYVGAGFSSLSEVLLRASTGYSQGLNVQKTGTTGVVGASNSLWGVGNTPSAGSAGGSAPSGTAHDSSEAPALTYVNPSSGTMHLTGADMAASVANNALLLYDRLFSVAKTMASTSTEAVSGTPSRYQSTTSTNPDYIGGNFGFIETQTALAATAHNWTVCTYTDQGGNSSTMPSTAGISGCIINRLDMPLQTWFVPLESGDVGIKAWTQMQCSASVATGAINFVIGHPIGFMVFPVINTMFPFDWLTNRDLAPRIFDSACLAFLEPNKPATGATNYTGRIVLTSAPA